MPPTMTNGTQQITFIEFGFQLVQFHPCLREQPSDYFIFVVRVTVMEVINVNAIVPESAILTCTTQVFNGIPFSSSGYIQRFLSHV